MECVPWYRWEFTKRKILGVMADEWELWLVEVEGLEHRELPSKS